MLNDLKSNNWIDDGTRAVFLSINFFDPNNGVNITLVTFIEMSVSQANIPGFRVVAVDT